MRFDRRPTVLDIEVDGARMTGVATSGRHSFKLNGVQLDALEPTMEDDQ